MSQISTNSIFGRVVSALSAGVLGVLSWVTFCIVILLLPAAMAAAEIMSSINSEIEVTSFEDQSSPDKD